MKNKDYKTIVFYKLAQSLGAIKQSNDTNNININDLVLNSFLVLNKKGIFTYQQTQELEVFKDNYNRYLEYCIEHKLIHKNNAHKIKDLKVTTIPDMTKIEIPDIKKELEEMNIDLSKISNIFGSLSTN